MSVLRTCSATHCLLLPLHAPVSKIRLFHNVSLRFYCVFLWSIAVPVNEVFDPIAGFIMLYDMIDCTVVHSLHDVVGRSDSITMRYLATTCFLVVRSSFGA